jgi:hypothetical protein
MPTIRVAIPAMDELEYLPATLDVLAKQEISLPFEVYVCVNQPDHYWNDPAHLSICQHNQQLLTFLNNYAFLTLRILDYSSPGLGWKGKKKGVGFSHKVLFDKILSDSQPDDIIVSLDADTLVGPYYLESVAENFTAHPRMNAVAVPYFHPLQHEDEAQDRAMLRYELYMRNYAINLLKISSPYGFTALGSAIAMRVSALRKIGNITPLQSGEDFYLVQKFCKMGGLSLFNREYVRPAGRYSDRVPFGTGPAMKAGASGVWESYPLYPHICFAPLHEAYLHLQDLYDGKYTAKENEFLAFLQKDDQQEDVWRSIRGNVSDFPHFVKAFHQKADGLRILQFVRAKFRQNTVKESVALYQNLTEWMPNQIPEWFTPEMSFQQLSISQMDFLRVLLFNEEQILRKNYMI